MVIEPNCRWGWEPQDGYAAKGEGATVADAAIKALAALYDKEHKSGA